jgi:hypothetical protein
MRIDTNLKCPRAFQHSHIYEHIKHENSDFMSQK